MRGLLTAAAFLLWLADGQVYCRHCGMLITDENWYEHPPNSALATGSTRVKALGNHSIVQDFTTQSNAKLQIATFRAATNLELDKKEGPAERSAFYPEYTWKPVSCRRCHSRLGWAFEHEAVHKCANTHDHSHQNRSKKVKGSKARAKAPKPKRKSKTKQNQVPKTPGISQQVDESQMTETELLGELPKCITLEKGWWSYKWCHHREIIQYHKEADGTKSTEWSLGKFDSSAMSSTAASKRKGGKAKPSRFYSHSFSGGQHCDETGHGRSTEVQFFCCGDDKGAYLQSISEPRVCHYRLKVCAPALCAKTAPARFSPWYPPCSSASGGRSDCGRKWRKVDMGVAERDARCEAECGEDQDGDEVSDEGHEDEGEDEDTDEDTKAEAEAEVEMAAGGEHHRTLAGEGIDTGADAGTEVGQGQGQGRVSVPKASAEELLAAAVPECVTRQEGWWTYRWCHKKDIRQFHKEKDGSITQDWSMGVYDASASAPSTGSGSGTGSGEFSRFHSHQFVGGQACDETSVQRKTEVRFYCCDEVQNKADVKGTFIRQITEPHTCQYVLQVCAPILCSERALPRYSVYYPPCGHCKRQFKRGDMTPGQYRQRCSAYCFNSGSGSGGGSAPQENARRADGQADSGSGSGSAATSAATAAARQQCEAKQAAKGTRLRMYGFMWGQLVSEQSDELAWAASVHPVTALSGR